MGASGGQRTGYGNAVDPGLDGADQADGPARSQQRRLHHVGGGGLARGPGDTDQLQALRGVREYTGTHRAQDAARVRMDQDRAPRIGRQYPGQLRAARRVGEDRGGTCGERVGGEPGAVRVGARKRGERSPGCTS